MSWIDEARAYIGFSEEDEVHLRAFHAVAEDRYDEVVAHFYEVIDRFPEARAVITGGAAQRARLAGTLRAWLASGLGGVHDRAWYEARVRIGARHVAIGLASRYMFTAIGVIRADLHRIVRQTAVLAAPTIDAIDRWLDLELAIMLQSYQESSEERLLERERTAQRERLGAMQRLSAGLAHEVRNPLNAAQLQLELLARRLRRGGAGPSLLEVTALVDGEIRRLSGLLQEFLDFARPVHLAAGDADLVAIARHVVEMVQAAAAERGVAVALVGDPAVVIACDSGKVHQILHNLVANAIDAAASRVEVAALAHDGGATIVVRDDGPGIPDAVLPRIYEPFYSTKERGTGMGLSITYSLVTLHGGTIHARNRGGAEFTVHLPATPPPPEVVRA